MINLLPPEEKENLLLEKYKRLTMVLGNVVLISLVCLVLILFYLKFYILTEVRDQKFILDDAEKKYQSSDLSSFKGLIQKYNAYLLKTDNFYKKEIYFSDVLRTISEVKKPKGVYFTDIVINKAEEENKVKVTVSGVSDTRDNLSVLKDNIENNKKIENAYFPPDNWIKSSDINFYMTLEIKKPI